MKRVVVFGLGIFGSELAVHLFKKGWEVVAIDTATRTVVGSTPIFADDPKALCASADGTTVWVAAFRSGNRTTIVPEPLSMLLVGTAVAGVVAIKRRYR